MDEQHLSNMERIIEVIKSLPDIEVQVQYADGILNSCEKRISVTFTKDDDEIIVELF